MTRWSGEFQKDNGYAIGKGCVRISELCRKMGVPAIRVMAINELKFATATTKFHTQKE